METRVLIVRHGQSTWNAARRWQGQADPPLTPFGEEQAFAAAQQLGQFDAIVSSDLQRAALTAQIIAHELGIGPVEPEIRLRERHVGEWEGLTREEIEIGWPGFLDNEDWPPMFEPEEHVAARATAALIDIAARFRGGCVLAVAHGGIIRVLRRSLGTVEQYIPNLGGAWFSVTGDSVRGGDVTGTIGESEPQVL